MATAINNSQHEAIWQWPYNNGSYRRIVMAWRNDINTIMANINENENVAKNCVKISAMKYQ